MKKSPIVIILHPDLELSLADFQKKTIRDANLFLKSFDFAKNAFFYPVYPLWIHLRQDIFSAENKEDLKKLSKKIIRVNFSDFLFYENGEINIGVKIKTDEIGETAAANKTREIARIGAANETDENDFLSKLAIAKLYKTDFLNENPLENYVKTKKTPFNNIKIFRLGIFNKISENSQDVAEFVWAKKNS